MSPNPAKLGFEIVRALPAKLVKSMLERARRSLVEDLGRGTRVELAPVAAPASDLPEGWARILTDTDPRAAIRALFARGGPRVARMGERLAHGTTHVGLATPRKGSAMLGCG